MGDKDKKKLTDHNAMEEIRRSLLVRGAEQSLKTMYTHGSHELGQKTETHCKNCFSVMVHKTYF